MAKNQVSPKPAKVATTQSSTDLPIYIREQLESLTDDKLERLERTIGEILAARQPAPQRKASPAIVEAVDDVRMSFLFNKYYTYKPPASHAEVWTQNAITAIKRNLHRLTPAEVISLSMYTDNARVVPLSNEYHDHIRRREEKFRQRVACPAKQEGRR